VLAWDPESARLNDLYRALDLPLAGSWVEHPLAPWQHQIAPAMDRIVRAEAAAMQVSIADLLATAEKRETRRGSDRAAAE
jgi:hypothetical protein